MKHRIAGCLLLFAMAVTAGAQGGTKSPYSQFGIGMLNDPSQSMSRGMNGVGYALRQGSQVNTLNPASYSGVDSLTMLFDMGLSGQFTSFEEGSVRRNVKTAAFEYAVGSFRLWKNVGLAFGVLPYSSVGFDYKSVSRDVNTGTLTETFTGSGGLHQAMIGVGTKVIKPLSVGVNVAYLWGDVSRTVSPTASTASNTLTKTYSTSVSSYKLDAGVQWEQPIGKTGVLTLGAIVGFGHNLKNTADMTIVSKNTLSNRNDTASFSVANALELPMSYGGGVAYNYKGRLTVAADFLIEKWGDTKLPNYRSGNGYKLERGLLKDRKKAGIGLDYVPKPELQARKYTDLIHYRIGAGLATPYYNINGHDGPTEISLSAGIALPIVNKWNNRSVLNISGQWVRTKADGFITDNTFRINIGITFNERWFMKMKVD